MRETFTVRFAMSTYILVLLCYYCSEKLLQENFNDLAM